MPPFPIVDPYGFGGGGFNADGTTGAAAERSCLVRPDAIRLWRSKAYETSNGGRATVALIGDSQFRQSYGGVNVPLIKRLRAAFGDGGPGYVPAMIENLNQPDNSSLRGEATLSFGSGWSGNGGVKWSPNQRAAASYAAGSTFALPYADTGTITQVDVHHGGGVFQYRYGDSGAYTQVDCGTTPGKVTLAVPPVGAWTLNGSVVSGTVWIAGIALYKANGCVVHNLSASGSQAAEWSNNANADWQASLVRLGFDAIVFELGGNDEAAQTSTDTYAGYVPNLMAVARVAQPAADRIWVVRAQGPRSGIAERMDDYAARVRLLATSLDFAMADAKPRFGLSYAEYGYTGTLRQLLQADGVHCNPAGAAILASGPADLLLA